MVGGERPVYADPVAAGTERHDRDGASARGGRRTGRGSARTFAAKVRVVRRLAGLGALAGLLVATMLVPIAGSVGVGARDAAAWFQEEPGELNTGVPLRSRILAADGSTIATFFYENRVDVRLDRISPTMRRAVLAIEDSRFYEHGALDAKGTVRALASNLGSGEVQQGGSGITQQYVKNLLLTHAETEEERQAARALTPARKIRELKYAAAMERRFAKDEILRRYLNIAYYGDGAYGVEAAARHYFGKSAAALNLTESALLAGVIRYPYAYDPIRHPDAALKRRDVVLDRMAGLGWIGAAEARQAKARPLGLRVKRTHNGCVTSKAPFFCDYVQREILTNPVFGPTAKAREKLLKQGGLTIRTTLDWKTQRAAQRAVNRYVPRLNSARKAAAEALVEPGTGHIKGMAVDRLLGPDRERGKTWINFAADASHGSSIGMQAGSTFKAFTLAAALEEGMPFGQRFMAPRAYLPTGYRDCKGRRVGDPSKALKNSADGEGGRTFSLVTGTEHSVNTFFLALQKDVGLCDTVKMAERLGMKQANGKPLEQYPAFTLGFAQVSPLRLAAAYAAFGARGRYCKPVAITQITDSAGHRLKIPSADCRQALDEDVADAVNHVLRGVLTKGTARGMGIGRPAAGKTGTVDNFSAAWFAGYTPDLASAVWVGDPRGGYRYPMTSLCMDGRCYGSVFGATLPAPIWQDTMAEALAGRPATPFRPPSFQFFTKGSGEDPPKRPKRPKRPRDREDRRDERRDDRRGDRPGDGRPGDRPGPDGPRPPLDPEDPDSPR
ncbi:transglycosylase domain-containing protein [Actinomadura kijaniata]